MQRARIIDKFVLRLGHWRVADARRSAAAELAFFVGAVEVAGES
jgi:hypothetical protein